MTDTPPKPERRRWRWLVVILVFGIWWSFWHAKVGRGHHETSPDGKWRADVMFYQERDGWLLDYVEMRHATDPAQAMKWRVDPAVKIKSDIGNPIRWSADSSSVDIVLDGRTWITVRTPPE